MFTVLLPPALYPIELTNIP